MLGEEEIAGALGTKNLVGSASTVMNGTRTTGGIFKSILVYLCVI